MVETTENRPYYECDRCGAKYYQDEKPGFCNVCGYRNFDLIVDVFIYPELSCKQTKLKRTKK